jgi:hypothetical protein
MTPVNWAQFSIQCHDTQIIDTRHDDTKANDTWQNIKTYVTLNYSVIMLSAKMVSVIMTWRHQQKFNCHYYISQPDDLLTAQTFQ